MVIISFNLSYSDMRTGYANYLFKIQFYLHHLSEIDLEYILRLLYL